MCLLAILQLDVCWPAESFGQSAHTVEFGRAAKPPMHAQQTFIYGRKHRLTSLQQTLTDFTDGTIVCKTWTDSVWGIAVHGQQEYQMQVFSSTSCKGPVYKQIVCRCMWLRGSPFPTCLL